MIPEGKFCGACPLQETATGFMEPDGNMESGVMIVGEMLGHHEAKQGKASVGPGGFLLGRIMGRLGWKRDFFRFANVLWCQPKGALRNKKGYLASTEMAFQQCGYLDEEIRTQKPKVFLALGETAFERLTGEWLPIEKARGYLWPERWGRGWVIPTYHPNDVIRGMNHLAMVVAWDLEKAVWAASAAVEIVRPTCMMDPSGEEWDREVEMMLALVEQSVPLALDIETPYKRQAEEEDLEEDSSYQIDRVSFAVGPMRGVSVAWKMPYLPGIERLVKAAAKKMVVIWNRPYDRPRVMKSLIVELPLAHCRDTMVAWHVLYNALPKKLGFASSCLRGNDGIQAWKHLNHAYPEFYSAMDAVMLWRNDDEIQQLLAETGQMGIYRMMCEELDPVLERMTLAGLAIDVEAQAALRVELGKKMENVDTRMQLVVPKDVKGLKVWKTKRAAVKGLLLLGRGTEECEGVKGTVKEKTCGRCGQHPVVKTHVTRKTVGGSLNQERRIV